MRGDKIKWSIVKVMRILNLWDIWPVCPGTEIAPNTAAIRVPSSAGLEWWFSMDVRISVSDLQVCVALQDCLKVALCLCALPVPLVVCGSPVLSQLLLFLLTSSFGKPWSSVSLAISLGSLGYLEVIFSSSLPVS